MRQLWDEIDEVLYAEMRRAGKRGEPISTHDLTEVVNETLGSDKSTAFVRSRCNRMHRLLGELEDGRDWVKTEVRPSAQKLFFFPPTGAVLSNTSFAKIGKVAKDLKEIALSAGTGPRQQLSAKVKADLKKKYRSYFAELGKRSTPAERARLRAFEKQFYLVFNGTTRTTVTGELGLRQFHGKERCWTILPGRPVVLPMKLPRTAAAADSAIRADAA